MTDRVFSTLLLMGGLMLGWGWHRAHDVGVPGVLLAGVGLASLVLLERWIRGHIADARAEEWTRATERHRLLEDFVGYGVYLHGDWPAATNPCAIELKEAAADAVDAWAQRTHDRELARGYADGQALAADRWWRR